MKGISPIWVFIVFLGLLMILLVSGCPGSKTRVTYEVEFWRENELCEPPKEFTIYIRNVTDKVDLPKLKWDNPKVGVYSGMDEIKLKKDTDFKLIAKGGDAMCAEANKTLKVDVVDQGDFHEMCFSGKLDWPNCTHKAGFMPFGAGVLVDHISNPSHLGVRVGKDAKSEFIAPYGDGYSFSSSEAAGNWSIGLTSQTDCNTYASWPVDQQKLCVDMYLKCNCP
jgi:hypothetical protein